MTLYKRRRVWWVEYQVDGKRYRQSTHATQYAVAKAWVEQIKTAKKMPTFEEAVEVLKMFYRKPVEGLLPIDSTWSVYYDIARAIGKTSITEKTLHNRQNVVKRFIEWLHKYRPTVKTIEAVTGPIAAGFATYLNDVLKLKSKTRINNIAELCTVWKTLENASSGVRNPWSSLRPQDVDGEIGRAFTKAEEERVLEAAQAVGKDWFAVCTIMRHTGIRYGDVATLTWSEISEDAIRLTPNKTRRKKIAVVIPTIEPVRKVIATVEKTGDYLFPLHADLYEHKGEKSRLLPFKEVLDAAGLGDSGYTVHSWRHTAATRLAEAGADIETRKRILGHTEDATANRYDHDEHLTSTRQALEAAAG